MDIEGFISTATALVGVPGYEREVGDYISDRFREHADEVTRDVMENVIARVGKGGPKVMIAAHHDEIGLVVTAIEDDGCIRFHRNGGVDPRILPGMEVSICARDERLFGVIGAKPPHLLSAADRKKSVKFEDLHIDIGMPAEMARARVRVGDPIVMLAKPVKLAGGCMAAKTMDDRACVASLLVGMALLKRLSPPAEAYFVASSQEEIGLKGARTAAQALEPDFAIAIDVTHGEGPGTGKWEAFPLDRMTIVTGPNLHPALVKRAEEVADKWNIPYAREVASGVTGTDAGAIQVAHGGVPVILLTVPLRYMHTTVETLKLDVIRDVGRLVALLIDEVSRDWEGMKWY
ncbi:MAG: M20/M25/M40 family metallo-hydrolase [Christensenellales bacterium]